LATGYIMFWARWCLSGN